MKFFQSFVTLPVLFSTQSRVAFTVSVFPFQHADKSQNNEQKARKIDYGRGNFISDYLDIFVINCAAVKTNRRSQMIDGVRGKLLQRQESYNHYRRKCKSHEAINFESFFRVRWRSKVSEIKLNLKISTKFSA